MTTTTNSTNTNNVLTANGGNIMEKQEAHVIAYFENLLESEGMPAEISSTVAALPRAGKAPRSEGMKALHATGILVEGNAHETRDYGVTARGAVKVRKDGEVPTAYGDSMADPEVLGMYCVTVKQAEMANRRAKHAGIEDIVLDSRGRVRGGKSGKTRKTLAQRNAERAAKRAARNA